MTTRDRYKDEFAFNITQLANAFEMRRETVREKLRKAAVHPVDEYANQKLFLLKDACPVLVGSRIVAGDTNAAKNLSPRDRKDWYQSENERLKYETAQGELVTTADAQKRYTELLKLLVAFVATLTDRMERTRTFTIDQLTELDARIDEFRQDLYETLLDLDDPDDDSASSD